MLDISATTLYGALRVTYVFPLKTFTFNATVSANIASIVTVNGKLDMLVSPDEWYVFVGTSANPIQAKIKILEIVGVTIHAYFMTGNTGITFPEPPMQVLAAFPDLKASRENQKILQEQSNSGNKTSAGMAFGAGFQLDAGGCFGPICLNINSGVGFDIALTKKDECIVVGPNGRENYGAPGFNGWYAEGQLYGYLQFGLEIDCSATTAEVVDGLSEVKGPDGTVRMKGNMRHGRRHGIWTSYHAGGAVQSTSGYVDGVLMGPSVVYHPNGQIYYTGDYRNNNQVGEWCFYDGAGSLVKTVHYDSAGTVINDR